MSDKVDIVISESAMAENMGVEVGIAAPSLAVQKLLPLPVFAGRHLEFCDLPSSTNVGQPQAVSPVPSGSRTRSKMWW